MQEPNCLHPWLPCGLWWVPLDPATVGWRTGSLGASWVRASGTSQSAFQSASWSNADTLFQPAGQPCSFAPSITPLYGPATLGLARRAGYLGRSTTHTQLGCAECPNRGACRCSSTPEWKGQARAAPAPGDCHRPASRGVISASRCRCLTVVHYLCEPQSGERALCWRPESDRDPIPIPLYFPTQPSFVVFFPTSATTFSSSLLLLLHATSAPFYLRHAPSPWLN